MKGLLAILLFSSATSAFAHANIVIVNNDPPGKGLNDATPAPPAGGNFGATLGAQRMIVFQAVAEMWGNLLNSDVDIRVQASFAALQCDMSSGVLGSTRAAKFVENFANAPLPNVWYPVALADALAGKDLTTGGPHMIAQFNSSLDTPTCLNGVGWYYGLDGNHGAKEDFLVVVLHEFAHGLGFSGTVDITSGSFLFNGDPSVFDLHVFSETAGLHFGQMSSDQRLAALTDNGKLTWDGSAVGNAAKSKLGFPTVLVVGIGSSGHTYPISVAGFGGRVDQSGVSGQIVAVTNNPSPADPSTSDACSAITNGNALTGNVALIDRGSCKFVEKAKAAQDAGASGVIIVDNNGADCGPIAMGGTDPSIVVPVVGVTLADGNAIKASLVPSSAAHIFKDSTRFAGTSSTGNGAVLLYAPCTELPGSTLYHWDASASPDLLMEAFIHGDTPHATDLTINQLIDVGWTEASTAVQGRRILKRGSH